MISKEYRNKILEKYGKKDDKIFVAGIIDLVNKFEINGYITHTSFLNLYEKNIAISILNLLKIDFTVFSPLKDSQHIVIFFIPEYTENIEDIYSQYVTCLKIVPNGKVKLKHKDYMGAIFNLGINEKLIGDIFDINGIGYVFMLKSLEKYFLSNLLYVSKNEVTLETLLLNSSEVLNLHYNFLDITITIPSTRIDVILSHVYNLSRSEVKSKIENGDLIINDNEMYFVAYDAKENDIVSFKKCGKLRIGKILKTIKSGNYLLEVFKYI